MTDEERQRQMDFIINTLAGVTVKVDALVDTQKQAELERKATELNRKAEHEQAELERKADAVRIGRLEEAMVTLARVEQNLIRLVEKSNKRLDVHRVRIDKHKTQLDEHETQIIDLKQILAVLTRIMNERHNGQS